MKRIYYLLGMLVLMVSCTPQMQLLTLKSSSNLITDNSFVYSDSLVRISYNFYSPNGPLRFKIQNTSNKPIFIDWKNSMSIGSNDKRLCYWKDESEIDVRTQGANVAFVPWISSNSGSMQGKIVKQERITFLPPKTEIEVSKFHLSSGDKLKMPANSETISDTINWNNSKKLTEIKHATYNSDNSPLKFRNYITISTTEDFKTPIYFDFGFWISEIHEMSAKQLVGDYLFDTYMDSTQMNSNYHPYKQANRFFIKKQ